MTDLQTEIEFYNQNLDGFRKTHRSDWVVISNNSVLGFYRRFEQAAFAAINAFGEKPFLIRQIDAPPITLPYLIVDD